MSTDPAVEELRRAVQTLACAPGGIRARLIAAEPHFGRAFEQPTSTPAEEQLRLGIGAGLVEGGDEDCSVEESIAALSESRAGELAGDILRLYELACGVRSE